ncbi:hypothetical protein EJ04DRAFT_514799 [Polyplosphaeria fusca]|uniref:Uncharacterized protein n=1 Tax=Polyplosphaeria fusca TaxID=682080 RepID=A0A9P4UZH4_9PLEO|nr:hypothetical protein EJ04DRAFT_514799 [Polyplosphaeria fusca]
MPERFSTFQACSSGTGEPIRCPRCQKEVKDKFELKAYHQSKQGCRLVSKCEDDCISYDFWEVVDPVLTRKSNAKTVEENYSQLYFALFPDDPVSPSPCGIPIMLTQLLY